jgi:hypothetical protein
MDSCKIKKASSGAFSVAFTEEVEEGINALPGDVPIMAGPAYAKGAKGARPVKSDKPIPTTIVPTLEVSKLDPEATKTGYLPGQVLQETYAASYSTSSSVATPEPAPTTATAPAIQNVVEQPTTTPATTPAPAVPNSPVGSQSFFKTETITKGREVVHVLWVEEVVTVTGTVETVHTTMTQYVNPGEKRRRRRSAKHIHEHAARKRGAHALS